MDFPRIHWLQTNASAQEAQIAQPGTVAYKRFEINILGITIVPMEKLCDEWLP